MDELALAAAPGHDEAAGHLVLSGDAITLATFALDGQRVTFTWFSASGTDRATGEINSSPLGVIEKLDTASPRMLPDEAWTEWLAQHDREQRIVAVVHQHWARRTAASRRTRESGTEA
jgi:hypothetical protein